jgi:tRNA (adenine22-N1)-methyltransferase
MQLPKLDHRLQSAVPFVRQGAVVADVGTDHAYLPVYLTGIGQASYAVASDINAGPIERAAQHVAEYGLSDRVKTVRADGLDGIEPYHPTDIIIFGMGGELIARIIADAPWVQNESIRLILQPMTHAECVRRYLAETGFRIIDEVLSKESGKIYQTIVAEYSGVPYSVDDVTAELGRFAEKTAAPSPYRAELIAHRVDVLTAAVRGKEKAGADTTAERRFIERLKECL